MKIIADTHIWYYMGADPGLFDYVKDLSIVPCFVNIYELSKSENVVDKEVYSRSAIQKLFTFRDNVIYEPPLVFLNRLYNPFPFDPQMEIGYWLKFTSKIAKGHVVVDKQKEFFKSFVQKQRAELQDSTKFFNLEAQRIAANIQNKKKHKAQDTIPLTIGFLDFCVKEITKGSCSLFNHDLSKSELLIKTLDHFFKTIEISTMKIQVNDWLDWAILAYVQPGDMFWTNEKRWIRLIRECGCGHYLFDNRK